MAGKTRILTPVKFSDWAAPVVPVLKANGSIRLCGDYKVTVNKAAKKDTYPLPRIEDLFAVLSGGRVFFKVGFNQCIPANSVGGRIENIYGD